MQYLPVSMSNDRSETGFELSAKNGSRNNSNNHMDSSFRKIMFFILTDSVQITLSWFATLLLIYVHKFAALYLYVWALYWSVLNTLGTCTKPTKTSKRLAIVSVVILFSKMMPRIVLMGPHSLKPLLPRMLIWTPLIVCQSKIRSSAKHMHQRRPRSAHFKMCPCPRSRQLHKPPRISVTLPKCLWTRAIRPLPCT
jgi:hypothetical protein